MSDSKPTLGSAITSYYNRGREAARLGEGRNQLERLRIQELLTRFLPPAPASRGRASRAGQEAF